MKSLNYDIVQSVYKESGNYKMPVLLASGVCEEDIDEKLVASIIKDQLASGIFLEKARAFAQGKALVNLEYQLRRLETSVTNGVENWCRGIFNDSKDYCLFLGGIEKTEILENHTQFIGELFRKQVNNSCSIQLDAYIIMGEYKNTAFGIHNDKKQSKKLWGEDLTFIHFNIGPSTKIIRTWNNNLYYNLNGSFRSSFDFDKFAPFADDHVVASGDLFFLPPDTYHVGESKGFSIDLVYCVSLVDEDALLKRTLDVVTNDLVRQSLAFVNEEDYSINSKENFERRIESLFGEKWLERELARAKRKLNTNYYL